MTRRPLKRLSYKPALKPEDLDEALAQLHRDMSEAAAQLALDTARPDNEARPAIDVPDLSAQAEADLRSLLEEETLALIEPEGARGIRAHELTHEWQKKALAGLKRDTLSAIAIRRGMVPSSKLDDLAQQVPASYQWDEQVVARLVLDYAEDPKVTEGGPTSRVFMLEDPLDLEWTIDRLQYVDGRYYRTDIAKWFTFEHFKQTDRALRIDGSLRTYTVVAGVTDADVDRLLPEPSEFDAQLEVHEGSQVATVHRAANATVARSVMVAFKVATRAATLNNLPNTGSGAGIRPRSLHPTTEWLLDLVTYRLRTHLFRNKNAVLARFRYTKSDAAEKESATTSRKSSLRAVRFEGENLMVSPAACGLMWTEGRPLVDLTMMVTSVTSEANSSIRGTLPVRIAVEKDHVLVATGLASDAGLMNEVHRAALEQVRLSLMNTIDDVRRTKFETTIRAQAEDPDPDADDVLLGDESEAADVAGP